MDSHCEILDKWIHLYQKSYLIAEEAQITQIVLQLISELERVTPMLISKGHEKMVLNVFTQMMKALESKDYVRIHDLLEADIEPMLTESVGERENVET